MGIFHLSPSQIIRNIYNSAHKFININDKPFLDSGNSTATPLNDTESFTGPWTARLTETLMVAFVADTDMTVKVQFSNDSTGDDIDSTLTYTYVNGELQAPHRLVIAREYYRVLIENNSGSNQTYLRMQLSLASFGQLSSPINGTIFKNSDAAITRSIALEDEVSLNKYAGITLNQKFGENTDVDITGNEDIWAGGGVYTGFPTGAAEEFEIILADAGDVGSVITFNYLASNTDTAWSTAVITTTGTTTATGITGIRSTRGVFNFNGPTNLGIVTLRHVTTTANVFWGLPIGKGQTRVAADTVPASTTMIIKKILVHVLKSNTAIISGSLWIRPLGESPYLIRPFSASNTLDHEDAIWGGLPIVGFADVSIRVETCSANNTTVFGNFDYLLVEN